MPVQVSVHWETPDQLGVHVTPDFIAERSLGRMGDENFRLEESVSDLIDENHLTIVGGGAFHLDPP